LPDSGTAPGTPGTTKRLSCYVSTNMRASMEELARLHEARTGVKASIEVADARTLIAKIAASQAGDIFVCHDPFLKMLTGKGIEVKDAWSVASVKPVIAVPKGNPKKIGGIEDLARPGLRVGLTDANNSISGHIVTLMLQKAGVAERVQANVVKRTLQGGDIANTLVAGDIDACIVWNAVVFTLRDKVEAVDIKPEWRPQYGVDAVVNSPTMGRLELDYVRVTIATLRLSKLPKEAKAFAEFVASPEGMAVFAKNGFSSADPKRPAVPRE
jgi:molybdate transport system substrate-binding protein